jgi:hypothetical protein
MARIESGPPHVAISAGVCYDDCGRSACWCVTSSLGVAVLDIDGEAVVKWVYRVPPRHVYEARLVGRVMKCIRDM